MINPTDYKRVIRGQHYRGVWDTLRKSTAKDYARRLREDGYNATFIKVHKGYIVLKGNKKKSKYMKKVEKRFRKGKNIGWGW